MSDRRKGKGRKQSEWSPEPSDEESSEEEKHSYQPSKNTSDPTIKSKGFYKQRDSTTFKAKPVRGQTTEEISYDKLLECTHTDEISDAYLRLKPKKKIKRPVERA